MREIPLWAWPLILFVVAIFLLPMARLGIELQREPLVLAVEVGVILLVLLILGYRNGGVSPLEKADVCTPPASAWPRAPQPTANLAGCSGYNAPAITAHDIPETQAPRGGFPVPSP